MALNFNANLGKAAETAGSIAEAETAGSIAEAETAGTVAKAETETGFSFS